MGSTQSAAGAGELAYISNVNSGTTVNTWYRYTYWDGAKQLYITLGASNPALGANNALWKKGVSSFTYDVNGHMLGAVDAGVDGQAGTGDDVSFTYVDNAQGLTLRRDQMKGSAIDKQHRYLYVNGQSVGDIGNDGDQHLDYALQLAQPKTDRATQYKNWKPIASADFDQNYQPINASYPSLSSSSYTVQAGDNLYLIAARVWGDASMWYLLADANGLNAGIALSPGQVLTIPNKVTNVHNSSSTFRPYDAGAIMGDTSPTLPTAPPPPPPPRHKKGCGGLGQILMVIVAVVVTIYTAGAAASALSVTVSGATSTFATGLGVLSGAGVAGAGAIAGAGFAAAAIGGAVGSIAGQLTGMATGNVDKFSWGAVAAGALGAAAGAGISGALSGGAAGQLGTNAAFSAAVRNVATQGINVLTGQQQGFSWASVAVSAISAPLTQSVSKTLFGSNIGADGFTRTGGALNILNPTANLLAQTTVSALVSATTRVAIVGGKLDWQAVAADSLSSFVQQRLSVNGNGYRAEQDPAPVRDATPTPVEEVLARSAPVEMAARTISADEFASYVGASGGSTAGATTARATITAKNGDSISEVVGTSNPKAVEAFMRANGLTSSKIYAGVDYKLPNSADYAASTGGLGQAVLNTDNASNAAKQTSESGFNFREAGAAQLKFDREQSASTYQAKMYAMYGPSPSMTAWDGKSGVISNGQPNPFYGTFLGQMVPSMQLGLGVAAMAASPGAASVISGNTFRWAAFGGVVSGGSDVVGQYLNREGEFKWRWEQTAIEAGIGLITTPLGMRTGVRGNILLGGFSEATSTGFQNAYYGDNKSVLWSAAKGGAFSFGGTFADKRIQSYFPAYSGSTAALLQRKDNFGYVLGNVVGNTFGSAPNVIPDGPGIVDKNVP